MVKPLSFIVPSLQGNGLWAIGDGVHTPCWPYDQASRPLPIALACHLPQLRVLDEGVVGIQSGQDEPRHAVQHSRSADIHFQEREHRMGHQLMSTESPP